MKKLFIMFSVLCVGIMGLSGCAKPGKVTGGGTILSANGEGGKANFGFNADSCDATYNIKLDELIGVTGQFNYHDKDYVKLGKGGVKMNGKVTGAALCTDKTKDDIICGKCGKTGQAAYKVYFNYDSTNPKVPGEGAGKVCVIDNGEGFNAASSDMAYIDVESGPYAHYSNEGEVQGNIQSHPCESPTP